MKVSELIKELEKVLNEYGDLDVVKGENYVGSEEVTGVNIIRGHQLYISNKYLDNYSMRNIDKLEWVKKDLNEHLNGLSCSDCRNSKDGFCQWRLKEVSSDDLNVECFENKTLPYEERYKIKMLQNCIYKLNWKINQGKEY